MNPPIDTTYQKLATESVDQYNKRIADYNASKSSASTYTINGQPTTKYLYDQYQQSQNQSKPGYDALGKPIAGYTPPTSTVAPSVSDAETAKTALATQQRADQEYNQKAITALDGLINGSTPLNAGEQAQIDGMKAEYQKLIDQQLLTNKQGEGLAQIRGYQTGAAEYDQSFQTKTIADIVSRGAAKVADLQVKEASAIAAMTEAFRSKRIENIKTAWDMYNKSVTARKEELQKTIDDAQAAIKEANDTKIKADEVYYDRVTKPIDDLKQIAKNMGAPASVMTAMSQAKSIDEAYAAAGDYAAQGTGIIAEYNYAKAHGYTGSISQYQLQQETMKATAKAQADAYASGMSGLAQDMPVGLGGTGDGGSILAATGLSIAAFNYMTQGTASMSRMPAAQRVAIMKEAERWLNKKGVDISTFQSQYKAYNDVLQKNLARANQTEIMGKEVMRTADSLISVLERNGASIPRDNTVKSLFGGEVTPPNLYGFGEPLRAGVIFDVIMGNQTNNKFAQQYATQIGILGNDLAGYFAASRGSYGADSITDADKKHAAQIISTGMSKGSVEAFKDAIAENEKKITQVVVEAADSTRKQVWDLFGVGDKYKGTNSSADMVVQQNASATSKINAYILSNPDQTETVTKLMSDENFNDEQIAEYLKL